MNILGISCGRDASAAVLRDGVLAAHIIRERLTRRKHDAGICRATIEEALAAAKLAPTDIDLCAVAIAPYQTPVCHDPDYFDILDKDSFAPLTGKEAGEDLRMHLPLQAVLNKRVLSGARVRAHAAHAASSFYCSGFSEAAVLTHDSGPAWESGLLFYAEAGKLRPLAPHGLKLAAFYNHIAAICGLGEEGAGKLMGLSAYGKPVFTQEFLTGDAADLLAEARRQGYDASLLGKAETLPSPIAADLAASAQKFFSDAILEAAKIFLQDLKGQGASPQALCLGGGAALNCPSNSRLWRESGFDSVFIPPFCDNSGLSVGAAQWLWHVVYGNPSSGKQASESRCAMTGPDRSVETPKALAEFKASGISSPPSWGERIRVRGDAESYNQTLNIHPHLKKEEVGGNAPLRAAQDLAQNKIIGWFEGGSEAGPRALGHRSILADPRDARNSQRVNAIKSREIWRPFAPVCLLSELHAWFDGPAPSPFMLFTHAVRPDKCALIPAVVHVDGSARVQTVVPQDIGIYELLNAFNKLTGIPLLLNTSFNGANEPIVENPQDVLAFFQKNLLDVLYIDGFRLTLKDRR